MIKKSSWIDHQLELLKYEREAEIHSSVSQMPLKVQEAKGIAISYLQVTQRGMGFYGRPTFTLSYQPEYGVIPKLPSHSFSSGNTVGIWENTGDVNRQQCIATGVISKLTSTEIEVNLFEENPELEKLSHDGYLVRLQKFDNDVTYHRISQCLNEISMGCTGCASHLLRVIFGECELYDPLPQVPFMLLNDKGYLDLFNGQLDESQIDAVKFALTSKDLAVIHGPPGTGKTTTLIEIMLQNIKLGYKVLAVAHSNLAVDNMLEKLVKAKADVVRVGHPARTTKIAQQRSVDTLIENSNDEIFQEIRELLKETKANLKIEKDEYKKMILREEVKSLKSDLKKREMKLTISILIDADVILTTLSSSGNFGHMKLLPKRHFNITVIDECSQSIESACYMAILKAPKLLIAGDHHQLPPVILSKVAAEEGLKVSLMERIIDVYEDRVTRMLKTQYRMNSRIMEWASDALYAGQLIAHESVSAHLLCQLEGVDSNKETEHALILYDTKNCNFEEVRSEGLSRGNKGEAMIVAEQVKRLISSGVEEDAVAVITPYSLQVEFIKELLQDVHPDVEVKSVDGFQGREKEAILISLVRSNRVGKIGFLSEDRRLNVAVTRARRQLTIVCNTDTVCTHGFIKTLVDYVSVNGDVRSCEEFKSELEFHRRMDSYIGLFWKPKKSISHTTEFYYESDRSDDEKSKFSSIQNANMTEQLQRHRNISILDCDFKTLYTLVNNLKITDSRNESQSAVRLAEKFELDEKYINPDIDTSKRTIFNDGITKITNVNSNGESKNAFTMNSEFLFKTCKFCKKPFNDSDYAAHVLDCEKRTYHKTKVVSVVDCERTNYSKKKSCEIYFCMTNRPYATFVCYNCKKFFCLRHKPEAIHGCNEELEKSFLDDSQRTKCHSL